MRFINLILNIGFLKTSWNMLKGFLNFFTLNNLMKGFHSLTKGFNSLTKGFHSATEGFQSLTNRKVKGFLSIITKGLSFLMQIIKKNTLHRYKKDGMKSISFEINFMNLYIIIYTFTAIYFYGFKILFYAIYIKILFTIVAVSIINIFILTNKMCDKYYWKFYEYKEYILINYNIRLFFKYTLFVWFIFFVFYTPELIDFVKMLAITPFTYNDNDKLDRIITDLKLKKTINNLYNNYLKTNYFSLKLIEFKLYIVKKTGLYKKSNGIILAVEDVDLSRDLSECKESLKKVFESIKADENFKLVGYHKKMILHGRDYNNPQTVNPLHNAVTISTDTTFEEYYSLVRDSFIKYWVEGYDHYITRELKASLFGVDGISNSALKINSKNKIDSITKRSYSTSAVNHSNLEDKSDVKKRSKPSIKPLKIKNFTLKNIYSTDIETIILNKLLNTHIPSQITLYSQAEGVEKTFLIDIDLLNKDVEAAVKKMFREYLDYMTSLNRNCTIFAHNLGGYDGYFIYKYFLSIISNVDDLNTMIDNANKFITIEYSFGDCKLTFKDSLRIFPGTLNDICKQFGVKGKLSDYKSEFNTIDVFSDQELLEEYKKYGMQDSIALYNALINAQQLYFDQFNIDICDIVSTASLAFKIFRTHYLETEIPLLTPFEDEFVRTSYLGGATDYYKCLGDKVYHYDINSLYPYAMLEDVPYKAIAKHDDLKGIKASDFKGFVLAKVKCPQDIKHPIVAYKHDGRTIYPKGEWVGVYFSDYLAKAETYGYTVELLSGIEFEYKNLFSDYIFHFYDIKKSAKGSLKYLAKLKLNSLYGVFGRKQVNNKVINIKDFELDDYMGVMMVKNIIDYDNGYISLVIESGTDENLLKDVNSILETEFKKYDSPINSNVAIASAITARAQMIMMDYKNNPDYDIYYTDTDSIFTNKPIPDYLIGDDIGQMKNETFDKFGVDFIDEACFIGIKKYGLSVTDKDGINHSLSTFAGVEKNTLTFNEVLRINKGEIIEKGVKDRFMKSFTTLDIKTQKDLHIKINNNRDKLLIKNDYRPLTIDNSDLNNLHDSKIQNIVNRFYRLKKKCVNKKPKLTSLVRLSGFDSWCFYFPSKLINLNSASLIAFK
jgi:hypothetical protein